MASLYRIRDDGSASERWQVGGQRLIVGRGDNVGAHVVDHALSRQHFAIVRDENGYVIEDLNSNNGTWVDGRRIRVAWLNPGDCIVAGQTVFIFQVAHLPALIADSNRPIEMDLLAEEEQIIPRLPAAEWPESWLVHAAA